MLHHSSTVLVLDYEEVVFRSFNSGPIDVQTKIVLSAVLQLSAFKDNLTSIVLVNKINPLIFYK